MSLFVQEDGVTPLNTQWGHGLPTYTREPVVHRTVPSTFEGLAEWCYVDIDPDYPDRKRNRYLAYHSSDPLKREEVTMSFQGFVKKKTFNSYGNWNGQPGTAVSAVQGLTLHGGPCRAVFDVQATYVDNLRRFVVTFFGKEYEGRKRPQLEFFRPVFTKVANQEGQKHTIDYSERRGLDAEMIRDKWRLRSPIPFFLQEEGDLRKVTPQAIQVGDFVNVIAAVDIAYSRDYNRSDVHVSFRPIEVVRLGRVEVPRVTGVARKDAEEDKEKRVIIKRTRAGETDV